MENLHQYAEYALLVLLVLAAGAILVGIGVAVNRCENIFARKQFAQLAATYQGTVQDAHPFFGNAPLAMSGTYQGKPFRVETVLARAYTRINGVPTSTGIVRTKVSLSGQEVMIGGYMKTARKRRQVEAALAKMAENTRNMSEFARLSLFIGGIMVVTMGSIAGLIFVVNRWLASRARRQFRLLADTLHLPFIEPKPTFGSALFRIEGTFQQQHVLIESFLSKPFIVSIGNGVNTTSQAILTRVQVGERKEVFSWYMTSARRRKQIETYITATTH